MRDEILVGIFGFMQLAFRDSGYKIAGGKMVLDKRASMNEKDMQSVYNWVADKTKRLPLEAHASKINEMTAKLLNKDAKVNNYYMALHLVSLWVEKHGNGLE
jgi:hypothetical protein